MSSSDRSGLLEVERLSKRFGAREAVASISFTIRRGEIYGLLGPNGAGKTTSIRMIAGILPMTSGRVRVAGEDAASSGRRARRSIGLVPQSVALYPALSAEENLRFFARVYGVDATTAAAWCGELLALAGLEARRCEPVSTFSQGMRRRLSLVCGLVHSPDLLLLDEPTVGVDPQSRERIYETLRRLAQEGLALLLTTHYLEEAERLCGRIAVMDEGRFAAEGTLEELRALAGAERVARVELVAPPGPRLSAWLRKAGATELDPKRFRLPASHVETALVELSHTAAEEGNALAELSVHRPNLGDVFLSLTGKALRD